MTPVITKYTDDLIKLIAEKVSKAKNFSAKSHVKFADGQKKVESKEMKSDASSSSSSESESSDEEMKEETLGVAQLKFVEPDFPKFSVKLNQSAAKSVIFKNAQSGDSKTTNKSAKISAKKAASME